MHFVSILLLCFTHMPYAPTLLTPGAVPSHGLILTTRFITAAAPVLGRGQTRERGAGSRGGLARSFHPQFLPSGHRSAPSPPRGDGGTVRAAPPGSSSRPSLRAGICQQRAIPRDRRAPPRAGRGGPLPHSAHQAPSPTAATSPLRLPPPANGPGSPQSGRPHPTHARAEGATTAPLAPSPAPPRLTQPGPRFAPARGETPRPRCITRREPPRPRAR